MESGTGVRASVASRYSQDASEADDDLFTSSFGHPYMQLEQTHSSFAFDDAASFSTQQDDDAFSDISRQSQELPASADGRQGQQPRAAAAAAAAGASKAQRPSHASDDDGQAPPASGDLQQRRHQRRSPGPAAPAGASPAAASMPGSEQELPSGRQSAASHSRSSSRAASLRARASADSLQLLQASHDSLPSSRQQQQRPQQQQHSHVGKPDERDLGPRPSSSSPVKHHASSHARRSSSGQQPGTSQSAQGSLPGQHAQQPQEEQQHRHERHRRQQQQEQQPQQQPQQPQRQEQQERQRRGSGSSSAKQVAAGAAPAVRQQPAAAKQRVHRHNQGSQAGAPGPAFQGDVSKWGRTALEDFYDDDDDDCSITSSHATMSSGISPRDTKPRLRPFDPEAARQTLAYTAGMYSRAQALRRDGTAPAALGVADDLPTRMAYQQLNVLAGMAGKVQDAILHNKRMFEQRMLLEDRSLLRKAFASWRAARFGTVAKQDKLRRAVGRIARGALSRAFFAWKDELHLVDRNLAMKRRVAASIARGMMRRCFAAWVRLAEERWWKDQLVMREREVALLEGKIRGYEKRPIQVLRKRRLSKLLAAWFKLAEGRRAKRRALARAGRFWTNQQLSKAWSAWVENTEVAARRRVLTQKVVGRIRSLQLAAAWSAWLEVVADKREQQSKYARAASHWQHAKSAQAWRAWCARTAQSKAHKQITRRWMQPAQAAAFAGWCDRVAWQKHSRLVVGRALAKLRQRVMAAAFCAWLEVVRDSKTAAQLSTKEDMQESLAKLQAENERLRRDNERFVRLIDSGEWGRGRVAELVSAGEVMQSEHHALLKLIGGLRREYEAVQMAKGAQEEELQLLKEKMTVGGPARNRLLVKGGSSFNALVRAMKQDLVDSGMVAKDPALLYEVDKLSIDRVQVFPDGELNVQAVASAGTSSAFARPVTRGGSPGGTLGAAPAGRSRPARSSIAAAARVSPAPSAPAYADLAGHTTTSVTVAQSLAAPGSPSTQRVLHALSSLTAAQVDQLQAAMQAGAGGGGAVPPAAASTGAAAGSARRRV